MQLVMHAYDEAEGRLAPVYAVCLAGDRAFARAMNVRWTEAARRVEASLNEALAAARCPAAVAAHAVGNVGDSAQASRSVVLRSVAPDGPQS